MTVGDAIVSSPEVTAAGTLQVIFVCTGNRARSPLAEALFRRRVAGEPVKCASFGILDAVARPALADAIAAGASRGLDLRSHRSRAIPPGGLRDADLVIGFEVAHIDAAIDDGGADPSRAFMLLALPDLVAEASLPESGTGVARARSVIEALDEQRASKGQRPAEAILDPFRAPPQSFAETVRVIEAMTGLLATALFPSCSDE